MAIVNLKDSLNNSIDELAKYQSGEKQLIKTNRPWLDGPGGVLKQSIILLLGASFSGKTTELQNLTDDIMDPEINPSSSNYVVCTHAFEMSSFSLTLKDIKKLTKKSYKEILSSDFTKEETALINKYFDSKRDGRYYINHETNTAEEIVRQTESFLDKHTDKELCLVELDHMALLKSKSSGGKKESIDTLVEMFNNTKLKYPNFLLVLLTQANRNLYNRIKPKSNEMKFSRNDIYGSDTAFHISDYCYALQNAYFLGVEEYRKIKPSKYPHLEHRFTKEDSNGKVSLYTEGCIFVEILKDRMVDDLDFIDLYTIELKPFEKEKDEDVFTSVGNMPVFNSAKEEEELPSAAPLKFMSPEDAFGSDDEDLDVPF